MLISLSRIFVAHIIRTLNYEIQGAVRIDDYLHHNLNELISAPYLKLIMPGKRTVFSIRIALANGQERFAPRIMFVITILDKYVSCFYPEFFHFMGCVDATGNTAGHIAISMQ